MTRVSKRKLKQKDFDLLYSRLHVIISKLSPNDSEHFFNELLSPSEKIMLTKRLSAIIMFQEKQTVYRVAKTLLISFSTAERIKLKYEVGTYRHIETILKKEKEVQRAFWKTLEVLLRGGMPSMGKDRWQSLKQH